MKASTKSIKGVVLRMTGGTVKARADRPGRAMGGRSPFSSARGASGGTSGSSNPTDTYGGTPK